MQYDKIFAGAYQIEKTLERSAYSVLCVGKKADTGQPVMLRLWLTAHAATTEEQERIQSEVAAWQRIQHPYLLPVLEARANAQGVFLVSTHTASGSLNDRLHQHVLKPLMFEDALRIIKQVGQALRALHQQGITHGNLTPHAVFFTEQDYVLLGEFRVQSILESIQNYQPALEENIPRCWYMAPEEFHGIRSAASDQYSLGCLAYLLLTGYVPFTGSARATLLQKHQRDLPKPLAEFNPAIPAHIEAAILKTLAKQPAERHNSIQAFLEALEQPQRGAIADQDTLEQAFHSTIAGQDMLTQPAPDPLFEQPTSVSPGWEMLPDSPKPVTTAAWTRTRGGGAAPIVLARSAAIGQSAGRSSRVRGFPVLLTMICLVLVIAFAVGGGILFSGGHAPSRQSSGQATPTSGLLNPATNLSATSTATSAQTATPVEQVSPTSSPTPGPTATPSSVPTTGGPANVTPLLDCVTSAGNNFVARFGYLNKGSSTVTIPRGSNNFISPSNLDGSQPTSFVPGTQHGVFQLTFFKHASVSWSLNGSTANADNTSPHC